MARYLHEKEIFKIVGTSDFHKLSPEQIERFVSILHKISPGKASILMSCFSDFPLSASQMVGCLRMKVLKSPRLKKKSRAEQRKNCLNLLNELDNLLRQHPITEENKGVIKDRIFALACLISLKSKKQLEKALKVIGLVAAGVIAAVSAILLLSLVATESNDSGDIEFNPDIGDINGHHSHHGSHDDDNDDDNDDDDPSYPIPEGELNNPFYEPFADPESPLYIEPDDEGDDDDDDFEDIDEDDESYAAEDYYDSRPWGDDNNGY